MDRIEATELIKATLNAFGPGEAISMDKDTWATYHQAMSVLIAETAQPAQQPAQHEPVAFQDCSTCKHNEWPFGMCDGCSEFVNWGLADTTPQPQPAAPEGMGEFLNDLQRSRTKYPKNGRMFDGLMGEVDELRRAYAGDGDVRAEAFDVAVCAYRIATEGDAGGNTLLATPPAAPVQEPYGYVSTHTSGLMHFNKTFHGVYTDTATEIVAVYTHPAPAAQRKPLTNEQILALWEDTYVQRGSTGIEFARAIEAAHGIKRGV